VTASGAELTANVVAAFDETVGTYDRTARARRRPVVASRLLDPRPAPAGPVGAGRWLWIHRGPDRSRVRHEFAIGAVRS
jgi:hypothetical protein